MQVPFQSKLLYGVVARWCCKHKLIGALFIIQKHKLSEDELNINMSLYIAG